MSCYLVLLLFVFSIYPLLCGDQGCGNVSGGRTKLHAELIACWCRRYRHCLHFQQFPSVFSVVSVQVCLPSCLALCMWWCDDSSFFACGCLFRLTDDSIPASGFA